MSTYTFPDVANKFLKNSALTNSRDDDDSVQLSDLGAINTLHELSDALGAGVTEKSGTDGKLYRVGHVVQIEGALALPGSLAGGAVIFTLPEGFAPHQDVFFVAPCLDASTTPVVLKIAADQRTVTWVAGPAGAKEISLIGLNYLDPYSGR